jgi:hypothetical protein
MRDVVILFVHLIVTVVRLARAGGLRSAVAESVLDLEAKRLDFQHYYSEHRMHAGRKGHPPVTGVNADRAISVIRHQHVGSI